MTHAREQPALRIGELARRTGHGAKTLRYYEEIGLLRPLGRTRAGYRIYNKDAVERLRLIRIAQDLGFALEDVRKILDAGDAGADPCVHTLAVVDRQLERLAAQAQRLRELRKDFHSVRTRVSEGVGKTSPGGGLCSCLTDDFKTHRGAPAKRRILRKEERHGLPMH